MGYKWLIFRLLLVKLSSEKRLHSLLVVHPKLTLSGLGFVICPLCSTFICFCFFFPHDSHLSSIFHWLLTLYLHALCLSCRSCFLLVWSILMLCLCPVCWIAPVHQSAHPGLNPWFILTWVCDLPSGLFAIKVYGTEPCLSLTLPLLHHWYFCWIGLISQRWPLPDSDFPLIICPVVSSWFGTWQPDFCCFLCRLKVLVQ